MLHELLLALSGHPGHLVTINKNNMKVSSALCLLHPSESALVDSLLSLGWDAHHIKTFLRSQRSGNNAANEDDDEDDFTLRGLYVDALCQGLERVLEPYERELVNLERKVLDEGGAVNVAFLQHRLQPFQPVLAALKGLLGQMRLRKAHGCYILDVIYKASCSGVEKVREAMEKLLFEGHKVMYKQLLAWILQGSLYDPYEEFFIAELRPSLIAGGKAGFHGSMSQLLLSEDSSHQFVSKAKKYHLVGAMVPGHISIRLAEKIFFIGESIQLFESDRRLEVQGAVLREREAEFYKQLAELRDQPSFRASDFERFVDSIGDAASGHLHSLVLERADLRDELNTARNFFFLGRGELFQAFITQADPYLQKPVTATTQHDVNQAFLAACRSILLEDDVLYKKIKMVVSKAAPASSDDTSNITVGSSISSASVLPAWECLSIQYSVPWPLHLILTDSLLTEYNRVFTFLITVKRTQLALQRLWADDVIAHGRLRKRAKEQDESSGRAMCQLRSHMIFVVDNLQQYFMADVLESQFATLSGKLDASVNFEQLRHAHDVFVNNVVAQIFLDNKAIHHCLSELLNSCQSFCRLVSAASNSPSAVTALSAVGLSFGRQSGLLFQLLTSLRNHQEGSHLAQLLLRIDFNRYFSKHGHDIGKIAAV